MDLCRSHLFVCVILLCVATCRPEDVKCTGTPNTSICSVFAMRMAWFYDSNEQECRTFMYGGCGDTGNVYRTEDDCYARCAEKLITLHPPWNLRAMAIQHNSAALIWYRPINYHLHEKLKEYLGNSGNGYATVINKTNNSDDVSKLEVKVVPHSGSETSKGNTTADSDKSASETTTAGDNNTDGNNVTKTSTVAPSPDNVTENKDDKGSETTKAPSTDTKAPSTNTKATSTDANKMVNDTDKSPVSDTEPTESSPTEPPVPSIEEVAGNATYKLKDYIGKERVPFHFARLMHYIVSYKAESWPYYEVIIVPENATFLNISTLHPDTEYHVKVSAVYQTNTSMETKPTIFRTRQDPTAARKCYCDPHGTIGGSSDCNMSMSQLPWCPCKPGYGGLFCEICARGFYRTGATLPCHQCPCTKESSTGSCHFVEGYLHCLRCHEAYSGILCHRCANGYYRDYSSPKATCRKCVGCHNIKPGRVCDPFSGHCLNCHYNTTGEQCDRCLPGYVGDPLNNVTCEPGTEKSKFKPPPSGIIASIVVGTIVLLSGIVGIIVYRRIQQNPKNRPFWTIEFQEDHDGVNFSSVPNDEADRNVEDLQFYEDHQKTRTKSQPYSRLQEDI